ncbi:MAG: serine/threonine protein kinase [Acidobacteria bacterium]|nr:serine/threonine protein kinase [Acidobacteriota bacterium]
MDIDQLRSIDQAFQDVLGEDEPHRSHLLRRLRRNSPAIADAVLELLKNMDAANEYLDQVHRKAIDEWTGGCPQPASPVGEGCQLGAYKLLAPLGQGGMGSVFLAERSDGAFEKQVAIKVMRYALPRPTDLDRFRKECQLQAQLEHPNIARVLDSGIEGSTSFLVMEYVQGEPIDQYCSARSLSVRERLQLFVQVSDAVQYAHRKLILHRDIKPSNVLVDEEGRVKLLDFGIAKILSDQDDTTATGLRMFSPGYASPEQLLGLELTTASDVYSLGVLLFELLTGEKPFSESPVGRVFSDWKQLPQLPSSCLSDAESGPGSKHFCAQLKGDLDSLICKALEPEDSRRYHTVDALRHEVVRYLNGLPIEARGDAWSYRIRKFVGRHRTAVGVGFLFVSVLMGFSVVTAIQSRQISAERDKYQQMTDHLTELIHSSDPDQFGGEVLFADVLKSFSEKLENSKDSANKAKVLSIMGEAYENLGHYQESEALLRRALAIQSSELGDLHTDTLFSQQVLGIVLLHLGMRSEAETLVRDLIEKRVQKDGALHHETLMARQLLAVVIGEQGRYEEAREALLQVVAHLESFGEGDEGYLGALENLARYECKSGHQDEGLARMRSTLALKQRVFGRNHPNTLSAWVNLGAELVNRNDKQEATRVLEESLAAHREVYGPNHPKTFAAEQNVARLFNLIDRSEEALVLAESCLNGKREVLGEMHPSTLACQSVRISILRQLGRHEEALTAAWENERAQIQVTGAEHPHTIFAMDMVTTLLLDLHRFDEARTQIEKTLIVKTQTFGPNSQQVIASMANLATVLQSDGRLREAVALKEDVLDRLTCDVDAVSSSQLVYMNNLAMGYKANGQFDRSEEVFLECLRQYQTIEGPTHFYTVCTEINVTDVLRLGGKLNEAHTMAELAMNHADLYLPSGHPRVALALNNLAMVWFELGHQADAHEALMMALAMVPPEHPFATRFEENLRLLEPDLKLALH